MKKKKEQHSILEQILGFLTVAAFVYLWILLDISFWKSLLIVIGIITIIIGVLEGVFKINVCGSKEKKKDDEFTKILWKSNEGVKITIEYEDFNRNRTKRSVLLKEIQKDMYELRESIQSDEKSILDYQDDLKNLDKKDEHYLLEKEEIMERIRELKQNIRESKKKAMVIHIRYIFADFAFYGIKIELLSWITL